MGLDHADCYRIDPARGQRRAVDRALRLLRRGRDVDRVAVLVGRRPADHGQHPIAVTLGVGESLEQHHRDALARDEPVGADIEGVAATGGRQHALRRTGHHLLRIEQERRATGEGQVTLGLMQAAAGHVDCQQAR